MAAKNRIYWVHDNEAAGDHLVEASSQAQAIRHVVGERYAAVIATPRNVGDMVAKGVQIEVAGASDAE